MVLSFRIRKLLPCPCIQNRLLLNKLKNYWIAYPLGCILILGLLFRLIAAFFSKGFGMIDDHFLIIEQAQSWVDHENINDWLPQLSKKATPPGFSFFYTGLHYLLFSLLQKIGIYNPQTKMFVVRILHAFYSLLTVYFGYRITEKLTNVRYAKQVGLLLALFWIWPFLSVRNLIEVVCIPMLMWATWLSVKNEKGNFRHYIWVGIVLGLAFNVRFQTLFFSAGFIFALLFQKRLKQAVAVSLGILLCAAVIQGGIDFYIWHMPFVEFKGYIQYNLQHATDFINLPWYTYLLLFAGILIPPISLFMLYGFFVSYKKYLLLFLPSFLFLLFHSYFPNKQERFILPILPFVMMLGIIGWNEFIERKRFDIKYKRSLKNTWRFFWVLNAVLLVVISFTYSKRNRVEAMRYLSMKGDVQNLIVENSNNSEGILSPRFYLQKWPFEYSVTRNTNLTLLFDSLKTLQDTIRPNYVIFYETINLQKRVDGIGRFFDLKYDTVIYPGFIDDFMYRINPVNDNAVTYIYKITGKK